MTRINALSSEKQNSCLTWGRNTSAIVFAAVLIICSVTVGCSSDQPKPVSHNTQLPTTQVSTPAPPVTMADNKQPDAKPAPKKVVHKKPATVNYTDKNSGLTFEYPRRYAIETGEAAADLLQSSPIPMNFVAPGGEALAAVELPESIYANTDFSSAFFNASVHKNLTPDQCNEFAVPAPKVSDAKLVEVKPEEIKSADVKPVEQKTSDDKTVATTAQPATTGSSTEGSTQTSSTMSTPEPQGSKLLLGDMELRGTEAVTGEGTRQSDSKYFHVYQNGACYEFGLNVTTVASADGLIKHVDRDKVFNRLEQILSTVKINEVKPAEQTAEAPVTPTVPESPAQ